MPINQLQEVKDTLNTKEYLELKNSIRNGLAQAVGGTAILLGLLFTWRNLRATERNLQLTQETTSKNLLISQEGQITERFTNAVEQLGNEKLQVRLGGIYALERIAKDSKQDYWMVIEILTAFVRANVYKASENILEEEFQPCADIQAVINVLSRRNLDYEQDVKNRIDLRGADLRGINLKKCNLQESILTKTILQSASLREIHLEDADLSKAVLKSARLTSAHLARALLIETNMEEAICNDICLEEAQLNGANLSKAKFYDSNLIGANLIDADLTGASLYKANLSGAILMQTTLDEADLEGANLTHTINLTLKQVKSAINYHKAILPPEIQEQIDREKEKAKR